MTFWVFVTGVLFFAAGLAELAIFVAPALFSSASREAKLKEEVTKLHHDISHIDKKLDGAKAATAKSLTEIESLKKESSKLQQQLDDKRIITPVLVYRISQPTAVLHRFRATVTKALPSEPDPQQALVWKAPAVIETWAMTPDQATGQANHHFRRELGYTIETFARQDEPAAAAAPAAAPAIMPSAVA